MYDRARHPLSKDRIFERCGENLLRIRPLLSFAVLRTLDALIAGDTTTFKEAS